MLVKEYKISEMTQIKQSNIALCNMNHIICDWFMLNFNIIESHMLRVKREKQNNWLLS